MSKIILKSTSTPAPPTEGQVVIYAQDGVMRTWSYEGSPASLSTFSAKFNGLIETTYAEYPPAEYYLSPKDLAPVYPLSSGVVITSVAVYVDRTSSWNVPLSIRAYRGISGEEPVDAGELVVLEIPEEPPIEPKRESKNFGGMVTVASGLNISLAGESYMTIAVVPVTEDPGDVYIEAYMAIVVTMSQA